MVPLKDHMDYYYPMGVFQKLLTLLMRTAIGFIYHAHFFLYFTIKLFFFTRSSIETEPFTDQPLKQLINEDHTRPSSTAATHPAKTDHAEENIYLTESMVSDILKNEQLFAFPHLKPNQIKSENNAAFPINSKLSEFFSSDFYLENVFGNEEMINDDTNEHAVDEDAFLHPANPLSKEAEWYKDYINGKNDMLETKITLDDY